MDLTALVIGIWVLLGLAVVWSGGVRRGGRVTSDEALVYNALRGL